MEADKAGRQAGGSDQMVVRCKGLVTSFSFSWRGLFLMEKREPRYL